MIRRLQTENELESFYPDADAASEQELMQIVGGQPPAAAPAPVAAPAPAPAPFNPAGFDWANQGMQTVNGITYAPQFESVQLGHGEEGGMYGQGALQGVRRYQEGQTAPGQTFEWIDPATGQVTGTGKFEEQSKGFFGDLFGMVGQAAADLAPVLQYTPLGPAVAAINAVNAARTGDVLPAIASVAGLGGYTDIANAAKAASALKNEDYLGAIMPALSAAGISDVGGFSTKDIGSAVNVARAIEQENPLALLSAASSYLPGPAMPGTTGNEITEGFFAPGGEGYYEGTIIPDWDVLPEAAAPSFFPEFDQPLLTAEPPAPAPSFTPPSDEVYEDIESLLARYEDQGYATQPTTAMPPMELNRFLEANIEDPGTVETLMQEYYPELYRQQIEVTGTPTERELFPEFDQPLLTAEPPAPAPTPAPSPAPAPAPAPTPAAAPAPSPAAAAKKKKDDLALLMMLSAMMTPQQKQEENYQLARILNLGPMDLLV